MKKKLLVIKPLYATMTMNFNKKFYDFADNEGFAKVHLDTSFAEDVTTKFNKDDYEYYIMSSASSVMFGISFMRKFESEGVHTDYLFFEDSGTGVRIKFNDAEDSEYRETLQLPHMKETYSYLASFAIRKIYEFDQVALSSSCGAKIISKVKSLCERNKVALYIYDELKEV